MLRGQVKVLGEKRICNAYIMDANGIKGCFERKIWEFSDFV